MSKIKGFIEDRNEAFASGDEAKVREYCEKYGIEIPEDRTTFLASMHKVICNMFLMEDSPITIEQYTESYDWLKENGYSPSIMGGEEDV